MLSGGGESGLLWRRQGLLQTALLIVVPLVDFEGWDLENARELSGELGGPGSILVEFAF